MDVSIVIVSYNTRKLLEECLKSLFDNTEGVCFETIVIDNNSTDGTQDMLREMYPEVSLICNKENIGFSRANNQGYESSTGEYLLFLNSDTLIIDNAIEKMEGYLKKHPEVGILGPKILNAHHQPTRSYMRFLDAKKLFLGSKYFKFFIDVEKHRIHFPLYDYSSIQHVPWVSGACLMIKRNVFREAGLFDEHYFLYLEDMDLCLQAHKLNYQVVYFPLAEIIHLFGMSSATHSTKLRCVYKKSMLHYFKKNTNIISYLIAYIYTWILYRNSDR